MQVAAVQSIEAEQLRRQRADFRQRAAARRPVLLLRIHGNKPERAPVAAVHQQQPPLCASQWRVGLVSLLRRRMMKTVASATRCSRLDQLLERGCAAAVTSGAVSSSPGGVTVHNTALLSTLGIEHEPGAKIGSHLPAPAIHDGDEGGTVSINVDALVKAASTGDEGVLELMVDSGTPLDAKDAAGNTPLIAAALACQRGCVELLLRAGADANIANASGEWRPLHAAAFKQFAPVVMLLLEHNADPVALDTRGRSPVDYASLSDAIWPLFERRGCRRSTLTELFEKSVLKREVDASNSDSSASVIRQTSTKFTVRPPWRPVTSASLLQASRRAAGDVLGD